MKRIELLPLALLLALCASFGASAVVGWFLLRHFGFARLDPLLVPGMDFQSYFMTRFFVWDGQWYDEIARQGYSWHPEVAARQSPAFFPLWALVIKPIYGLVPRYAQVGVVGLALLVAYGSIHLFFRIGRRLLGDRAAVIATVLYVFFPAGHFLLQSYPTGLMNLISLLVLRDVIEGREWRPALIAGIGTAAGPLMVVPGFVVWLAAAWRRRRQMKEFRTWLVLLGLGVLALSGLVAFIAWQGVALHDPLAFLAAQRPWDQHRALGERLWRFTWMALVLPDIYHVFWLIWDGVGFARAGNEFRAFGHLQFALDFSFMILLMLGLFWTIAVKPRVVLVYGVLAILFFIWFHGTSHNGVSAMRLIYICAPGFWGLGRALQSARGWALGLIGFSAVALVVEEICSDIGQLVL